MKKLVILFCLLGLVPLFSYGDGLPMPFYECPCGTSCGCMMPSHPMPEGTGHYHVDATGKPVACSNGVGM